MTAAQTHGKVRKTITLDADLIDTFDTEGGLSPTVNAVLRAEKDRLDESLGLRAFLDRLAVERGPVDEALVQSILDRW
jgi:hypothetical protein